MSQAELPEEPEWVSRLTNLDLRVYLRELRSAYDAKVKECEELRKEAQRRSDVQRKQFLEEIFNYVKAARSEGGK